MILLGEIHLWSHVELIGIVHIILLNEIEYGCVNENFDYTTIKIAVILLIIPCL